MIKAPIDHIDYVNLSDEEIEWLEISRKQRDVHPYSDTPDIRNLHTGTPETYNIAVAKWNLFVDYYKKFYEPYPWKGILFELNTILDIAPKINDQKTMQKVLKDVEEMPLVRYDYRLVWAIFNMAGALVRFRKNCLAKTPIKQKELVELLNKYIPHGVPPQFSDGTWYFYVWRQFGIVKIEKKGRYNYVSLP